MNPKKKIAFYIESMVVGGAEKVLIDLVNNLDKEQFDITVIAIFKKSVYSDYEFQFEDGFQPHIKYQYLIDNSVNWKYKAFNYFFNKIPKIIFGLLVKEQYDIEVAFYEGLPTSFVSFSNQTSKKIAWLHTHQERLYKHLDRSTKEQMKTLYNSYNHVVGVSQAVKSSFLAEVPHSSVYCLYNPIDDVLIREKATHVLKEITLPSKYWVTVGRLIPIKGYDRLIKSLARLAMEGVEFNLVMVGDGEKRNDLVALVKEHHLESKIHFLGNQDNPYPIIKGAELFISASIQEGLSTVVMESIILQTPVLATDCSGMDELIELGKTGQIVENSEQGLYNGIKQFYNDRNTFSNSNILDVNYETKINRINAISSFLLGLN